MRASKRAILSRPITINWDICGERLGRRYSHICEPMSLTRVCLTHSVKMAVIRVDLNGSFVPVISEDRTSRQ